jgi:hypothetical protein
MQHLHSDILLIISSDTERGWRKSQSAHLQDLCASSEIICFIESRKRWWMELVITICEIGNERKILVGNAEMERVDGRIMLKWNFKKRVQEFMLDSFA